MITANRGPRPSLFSAGVKLIRPNTHSITRVLPGAPECVAEMLVGGQIGKVTIPGLSP